MAADIRARFHLSPDDVTSRSMGASGVDILLSKDAQFSFPFAVEVKCQEKIALWEAWKQAVANQGSLTPLLVISRNRTEPLAVLRWVDLLRLIKDSREG